MVPQGVHINYRSLIGPSRTQWGHSDIFPPPRNATADVGMSFPGTEKADRVKKVRGRGTAIISPSATVYFVASLSSVVLGLEYVEQ